MKKRLLSPLMIAGLVVVMFLAAGCNRPDQQATLDTPVPVAPQVQPTLPPATVAQGEMPADLAATVAASQQQPAAPQAAEATPTPLPAQPEPTAVVVATSTPESAPAAAPTVASTAAPTPVPVSPAGGVHTVQPGERLFSIARLYNVNPYAIAQLNGIPAPYLIYPGQQLKIPGGTNVTPAPPPPSGGTTYTVLPGDNLFRIALKFGKSMQAIAAANGITNYNLIYPGQVLKIP